MSLVEVGKNVNKTPLYLTDIKEEVKKDIGSLGEITIKPEPLLDYELINIKTEKDDKKLFSCVHCLEFFEYFELYELHRVIHENSDIQRKHCPCCKKKYKDVDKFTLHIQEHLVNYKHCPFCNQIFFNQNKLKYHVFEHKKNGALKCNYCGKSFIEQKMLTIHTRVHTNERPFECDICNKKFKQRSTLKSHKELIHSEGKPKECHICHGKFCTGSSLNRHMKLHTTGRTIACKPCNKHFPNKELYSQHRMESHLKLSDFYVICPDCNEEFFTYKEYSYHRKYHISEETLRREKATLRSQLAVMKDPSSRPNQKSVICWLCGENILFDMFDDHKNEHMLMTSKELLECGVSKTFQCQMCETVTPTKHNLLMHMDVHMDKVHECKKGCSTKYLYTYFGLKKHQRRYHPVSKEADKSKKCFLCGLDLSNKKYRHHLNEHLQMNDKELSKCRLSKKYPCKQCNTTLPTKSFLLKHVVSHLPKKFTCLKDINCKNTLYTYRGLRVHQRSSHDEFICKHCNKSFIGCYKFMSHHHRSDSSSNNSTKKIFTCSWCSANFDNPIAMMNHYRSHKSSGFTCRICNTNFPRAVSIKKHMFRVHKQRFSLEDCYRYLVNKTNLTKLKAEEVFTCNWCKVCFNSKETLTQHERIHKVNKYQCNKCRTYLNGLVQYVSHTRNNVCTRWAVEALIPEAKELKCMFCGIIFFRYFDITRHISVFHLKDPYRCKFCDSSQPVESLRNHIMKRHPRKKKYFCVGCKAPFVFFKNFLQHRRWCIEYPLLNRDESKRRDRINEVNIKLDVDSNEEDSVDIPEKVAVNADGDIVVLEGDAASVLEVNPMEEDYLENIV